MTAATTLPLLLSGDERNAAARTDKSMERYDGQDA